MNDGDRSGSNHRIAVNMTWCRPGRVGGSEEYLCRQLIGLPEEGFDVTIYAPLGFSKVHADVASRHRIIEMNHDAESRARRILSESTWLYGRTGSADLVHHGGGTVPIARRSPVLLTIHDLQYLEYPEYFGRVRLAYLRWAMPRAVRSADLIAVPTQFVRRTVVDAFGSDEDDVVVVPHGVEPTLGVHATDENELRSRYQLGDSPIVVYPAVTHPHKGHEFILDVHRRFWANENVTLVLFGGKGDADAAIRAILSNPKLSHGVRHLGRVPTQDRDGLIKMARALVFPSRYEGFGAPVLEAMALGTPVIASDRACLPEVVADAGLVLPLDAQAWESALDIVERRHGELIARGLQRSRSFTSTISGRALASAYHRLLD